MTEVKETKTCGLFRHEIKEDKCKKVKKDGSVCGQSQLMHPIKAITDRAAGFEQHGSCARICWDKEGNKELCETCYFDSKTHPVRYHKVCTKYKSIRYSNLCEICAQAKDKHPCRYLASPCAKHETLGDGGMCIRCGTRVESLPAKAPARDELKAPRTKACGNYVGVYIGVWSDCKTCDYPYNDHNKRLVYADYQYLQLVMLPQNAKPHFYATWSCRNFSPTATVLDSIGCMMCGFSEPEHVNTVRSVCLVKREVKVHYPPLLIRGVTHTMAPSTELVARVGELKKAIAAKLKRWGVGYKFALFALDPETKEQGTVSYYDLSKTAGFSGLGAGYQPGLICDYTHNMYRYTCDDDWSAYLKDVWVVMSTDRVEESGCLVM
ncbi:Hypothetical protein POVN_LOCUS112 [uncultured virus]|nr:Hypothetical protein POVN_LOCUS112 [uncultured virus]